MPADLVRAVDRLVDGDGADVFISDGRDEVGRMGRPVMRFAHFTRTSGGAGHRVDGPLALA